MSSTFSNHLQKKLCLPSRHFLPNSSSSNPRFKSDPPSTRRFWSSKRSWNLRFSKKRLEYANISKFWSEKPPQRRRSERKSLTGWSFSRRKRNMRSTWKSILKKSWKGLRNSTGRKSLIWRSNSKGSFRTWKGSWMSRADRSGTFCTKKRGRWRISRIGRRPVLPNWKKLFIRRRWGPEGIVRLEKKTPERKRSFNLSTKSIDSWRQSYSSSKSRKSSLR